MADDSELAEMIESDSSQLPARPKPSTRLLNWTRQLWTDTETARDRERALKRWKQCRNALLPHRVDGRDTAEKTLKTGADDREVVTPFIFRSTTTTMAMVLPGELSVRWRPRDEVAPEDTRQAPFGRDPMMKRLAETQNIVTDRLLEEANWDEVREACVQDATTFSMGVLKCMWYDEMIGGQAREHATPDEQDNRARLQHLMQEAMLGRIQQTDPEWQELFELQEALAGSGEVAAWRGFEVENVPLWAFGFDQRIRDTEQIYKSRRMWHDVLMTRDEVAARFPFVIQETDEDGRPVKWTGAHPLDLDAATIWAEGENGDAPKDIAREEVERNRRESTQNTQTNAYGGEGYSQGDELLHLREVWDRETGQVYQLISGISYPVFEWVPKRTPQQWFPFVILVPNRVPGDPYGISDVELMKDEQDRINRKMNDEEKARQNGIGKGVYEKSLVDPQETDNVANAKPGSWTGVQTKADDIRKAFAVLAQPFDPRHFDKTENYQNLRQMGALPEQVQGVTGRADFSSEVQAAVQGASIMAAKRQEIVHRFLRRFYDLIGELAIWNVTPDMARQLAGQHALWPQVVDDAEAQAAVAEVQQQAQQMALIEIQSVAQEAMATGQEPDIAALQAQMADAQRLIADGLMRDRFGFPEPLTREALYRRLRIEVRVSVNGALDRDRRLLALSKLLEAMASLGVQPPPGPVLRVMADLLGEDDEIDAWLQQDPNQLVMQTLKALNENPNALQPEVAEQLLAFIDQVKQMQGALEGGALEGGGDEGGAAAPTAAA